MFEFLASDYPILLTLLLSIYIVARQHMSIVRWMWFDQIPWACLASRIAIGLLAAFMLWATVFDNWRQLLGYMMDEKNRWRSDPYLYGPPADAVRSTTFVLLGAAVIGMAYLYARLARGYVVPIIVAPMGLIVFFILNSFRTRFEVGGPLSSRSVDFTNVTDAMMTFVWFAMFYVVMLVLIVSVFLMLWGPAAIVVSLLYRATIGREHIEEPDMYRMMRERAAARHTGQGG